MRRRPPPPGKVWHIWDMPERLRHFDPAEWGCFTTEQWTEEYQTAKAAHWAEHQRWVAEHGVSVLEDLRAELARRRAEAGRPTIPARRWHT